jgi:class 3 adenylate cyclase
MRSEGPDGTEGPASTPTASASALESHGIPGRIQVSEATYQRLRGRFAFEERGVIDVKGKGSMHTYLLLARAGAGAQARSSADVAGS